MADPIDSNGNSQDQVGDDEEFSLAKSAGIIAGMILIILILVFCLIDGNLLTSIWAFVGVCLWWLIGIIIKPLSADEKSSFDVIAKVVSGFITGYLLSKIDPLINALLEVNNGHALIAEDFVAQRALIAFASFLASIILVFSARAYWTDRANPQAVI